MDTTFKTKATMSRIITKASSSVQESYELLEVLGSGAFGVVRKCRHKETGNLAAVKTIDKSRVDNLKGLQREIELLKEVHHPHIIELYDVYEDENTIHLVTELCTGGELYDKVIEKAESGEGHFSEEDAGILVRDILDAIRYCHDKLHIVHRDLKPENFLLKDENDDADVKIIDFGLSRRDDAPFGVMQSRVGTPYYVAPEVLYESYTYKCDIWSIGVITYILLCGFAPFAGEDDLETINLVKHGKLEFPSPEWDLISDEAKDFVKCLLKRDPLERLTAAEALKHPWIARHMVEPGVPPPRPFQSTQTPIDLSQSTDSDGSVSDRKRRVKSADYSSDQDHALSTSIRLQSTRATAFQKFLTNVKLRKAMRSTTDTLTQAEAKQLGNIFQRVDKNQDGLISIEELDQALESQGFSSSVKQDLQRMKDYLLRHPDISFDIRPYLGFVNRKARSVDDATL